MCSNCLNLSGNGWVPFFGVRQAKKNSLSQSASCLIPSNTELGGKASNVHLGRASARDDWWPQVDNDDDLIRSLSLVWSRPKLLHPADGINLATVKKSRAILHPPTTSLSCRLSTASNQRQKTFFPSDTTPQVVRAPSPLKLVSLRARTKLNQPQSPTCVALTRLWNIYTMLT